MRNSSRVLLLGLGVSLLLRDLALIERYPANVVECSYSDKDILPDPIDHPDMWYPHTGPSASAGQMETHRSHTLKVRVRRGVSP